MSELNGHMDAMIHESNGDAFMHLSCESYQLVARQVPVITEDEQRAAIRHLSGSSPCYSCIAKLTAFKTLRELSNL